MTEIVDDQGEVIERCRYSPYGKLGIYDSSWNELSGSSIGNPYFFTGREYDPESGLYYYRARMYSASLGRFLQTDPIGYLDDLNLHRYCSNNPTNWIDPWGLLNMPKPRDEKYPPGSWGEVVEEDVGPLLDAFRKEAMSDKAANKMGFLGQYYLIFVTELIKHMICPWYEFKENLPFLPKRDASPILPWWWPFYEDDKNGNDKNCND